MLNIQQVDDEGEWKSYASWDNLQIGCCDCGLVHTFDIRQGENGELQMRVRRDPQLSRVLRAAHPFPFKART